jgi:hypothetical protein
MRQYDDLEDNPNDPSHPDWDLSEDAGYPIDENPYRWPERTKPWYLRRWVHLIIAVFVIASLVLPLFARIG